MGESSSSSSTKKVALWALISRLSCCRSRTDRRRRLQKAWKVVSRRSSRSDRAVKGDAGWELQNDVRRRKSFRPGFRRFSMVNQKTEEYQSWLSKVINGTVQLQDVPKELRASKRLVLEAVKRDGRALRYAARWLRGDRKIVTAAIEQNGDALEFATVSLQNDIRMKLSAVKQKGHSYSFAWDRLQNDKAAFIEDVQKGSLVTKDTLHTHKRDSKDDAYQTWLSKVIDNSGELKHAPADLQDSKRFILKAVRKNPFVLEFAPYHLQNDKQIVMEAISVDCWAIKYAAAPIRDDEEFMLMVIKKDGVLLQFASERIRNNKRAVLQAVKRRGTALKYAADGLRKDKDVVMVAAFSDSDSFKYALGDAKQDKDCLTAAGIWDENYIDEISHPQLILTKKIALSTRFSLMPESEFEATNFTKVFKSHPLIKGCNFSVYSPNAFEKSTCDPTGDYTNFNWICRGTKDTCQKEDSLKTCRPTNACCWRYSYRCQLEKAKSTDGFMLQIVEAEGSRGLPQELGNGQRIETDMAQKIGTKIFRVHRPRYEAAQLEMSFSAKDIDKVVTKIQKWYDGGCKDMSECIIRFPRKL